MKQYLLATYAVEDQVPGAPSSPEEMQTFMERVMTLEAEMDASGAFVFGGALLGSEAASVLSTQAGDRQMTKGPVADTKEQIAGFYIINAADLEGALDWAGKVVEATQHAIEVRPFRATGRLQM